MSLLRRISSRAKRGRVAVVNANRRLPLSIGLLLLKNKSLDRNRVYGYTRVSSAELGDIYGEIEDRRRWNPQRSQAPAKSFVSARHRLQAVPSRGKASRPGSFYWPTARIGFEYPRRVLICVRRSVRREVLHARGVAGKVGQRRPRRGPYSSVRCV